jgi:hypothetical protein
MSNENKKTLLSEAAIRRFATLANLEAITPVQSRVVTEDSGREETEHEVENKDADLHHVHDLEQLKRDLEDHHDEVYATLDRHIDALNDDIKDDQSRERHDEGADLNTGTSADPHDDPEDPEDKTYMAHYDGKKSLNEQDAPEDEFAAGEEELDAEGDLAMGDEVGGLEDELDADADLDMAEDDEDEAQALAAELLADEAVIGAVGAALAALGDITSDGSDVEEIDDEAAMGELEMGAEEIVDVEDEEELAESLVNEIALRVAKRLLRRG